MKLKEARLQQSNYLLFYHSTTLTTQLLYLSTIRPAMPKQLKMAQAIEAENFHPSFSKKSH